MDLMISEVQITCIFLMGLFTAFLIFVIPNYTVVGMGYNCARKVLSGGTFLVMVHFIIQYILHKDAQIDEAVIRSVVNLSFGIPLSYLFNMSNYYLLRKGKVTLFNWLFAPILFVLAIVILVVGILFHQIGLATILMAVLYACSLAYYGVLQIAEYIYVVKKIRNKQDFSLLPYIKWIKWSFLAMVFIALGFPFMTFNHNLLFRSLYGLLSLGVSFFYVLSFMGYGVNGIVTPKFALMYGVNQPEAKNSIKTVKHQVDEAKLERMKGQIEKFEKNESYLKSGITLQEVADELGVTVYFLKAWLRASEYKKFSNWLMHLRLKKAEELLVNSPELGNDIIAARCGFCDRQYFQLQFRKYKGKTPSKWIKDMSEQEKKN